MKKTILTYSQLVPLLSDMANEILEKLGGEKPRIYGIPRGGAFVAVCLKWRLPGMEICDKPEHANIIVDDIVDSGKTRRNYKTDWNVPFVALIERKPADEWVVFPWEKDDQGKDKSATDIPIRLLQYIGEDVSRQGLKETPERFLKAWRQYTEGYGIDPKDVVTAFDDGAENYDQMVMVRDIPVYSHCEHHLAPFFGVAHVGYIPNGKILGLSKLSRIVDIYSRRLQVQERLTTQVAKFLQDTLQPKGVGVIIKCRHLCMESRGINRTGLVTTTSAVKGQLYNDASARNEFLNLLN
jgi:GTP cyclohydrolase I